MPTKGFLKEYCTRFGSLEVDMGFISKNQLCWALETQVENGLSDNSHKVIGQILFERGWMTPRQIDLVLNRLFEKRRIEATPEASLGRLDTMADLDDS